MHNELHIFEKSTHLFWGLTIFICTTVGTYLLAGSFITMQFNFFRLDQLTALVLFLISFRGIFVLSDPLYHFILYFDRQTLVIDIKKGDLDVDNFRIPVDDIDALKFAPHSRRKSYEAMFDFSTAYHLMYRRKMDSDYRKLLDTGSGSITLKVDDIAKIMRFVSERNPAIYIPPKQGDYFNL